MKFGGGGLGLSAKNVAAPQRNKMDVFKVGWQLDVLDALGN